MLGVTQNHQANNYNTYTEDRVQTSAGPVITSSVYVNLYDPCLFHSVPCSSDVLDRLLTLSLSIMSSYG